VLTLESTNVQIEIENVQSHLNGPHFGSSEGTKNNDFYGFCKWHIIAWSYVV